MGFQARRWNIGGGYHSISEVYYNGRWHHYDLDQAGWIMDPTRDHVMSLAEWDANVDYVKTMSTLGYQAPYQTTPVPKYFEDQDMPGWADKLAAEWPGATKNSGNYAFHDDYIHFHDMSFALRQGEYITLNWYPVNNDWPSLGLYTSGSAQSTQAAYEEWQGDGQMVYEPSLSNQHNDYYDGMYEDYKIDIVSDGLVATDAGAYAVWAVRSGYQIASSRIDITSDGTVTREISKDIGATWTSFSGTDVGNVKELYDFLLKISIPQGSKLRTIKFTTNLVCNPAALPRLSTVNGNDPGLWNDYVQKVRLYTYHQDEALTKNARSGYDATTTVEAPDCGIITSLSGYYHFGIPNPIDNGAKYIAALKMGAGSVAGTEVKLSDDFTQSPNQWVYNYVDMASATICKMRHPISGNATTASMSATLKENTDSHQSSAGKGRMRMHYDVQHSSYSGSENLVVSYNMCPLNGTMVESVVKPPAGNIGAAVTLSDTTGNKISGTYGDYYELTFDLTGNVGPLGILNNWVKIENPGRKPFAARATTPGEDPPPPPCNITSGNPVTSGLRGGSGTNIDNYCPELTEDVVQNLRQIHWCNWDQGWNKFRVATLGNSITVQNLHWEPLNGSVTGISNAGAINSFKNSTFAQNSWCSASNCKGSSHGNQSGQTIMWVSNQVPTVLSNDRPMIAAIMIGTNNVRNGWSSPTCQQSLDCWPDTVEFNMILDQLVNAGVIPIITTIPPIDDTDGGWAPRTHDPDTYLIPYNNKLRTLAQQKKLPLADLHQWCLDHGPITSLLSDWAHPSGCGSNGAVFSDDCLDGGSSGGLQNARNYMLTMLINDIVRFVVNGEGFPRTVSSYKGNSRIIKFSLSNTPNPFKIGTGIRFSIPGKQNVAGKYSLKIYNVKGQLVRTLAHNKTFTGSVMRSIAWDGRNNSGARMNAGLYIYELNTGSKVLRNHMILIR
jgi:hypothetical protein